MKQLIAVLFLIPNLLLAVDFVAIKAEAEKGNSAAQLQLADAYKKLGDCVSAEGWYRKAAEQSNLDAQWKLSQMLFKGCSDGKTNRFVNPQEAVLWLLKMAESKRVDAMAQLASCYERGAGVPKDRLESYKWNRIMELTDRRADKSALNALVLTLSKEDLEEGDRRVKEYVERHTPKVPISLKLKLVSGAGSQAVALINNQTFKIGETGLIKAGNEKITAKCVDIQSDRVVLVVSGATNTLILGSEMDVYP